MEATMVLSGYVGHNIELKHTRKGFPTVTFRVGTTPRIHTDSGWVDGVTTWMNVECYRSLAENVAQCVNKGDPVIVQGRMRTQAWVDVQGVQHERMIITASTIGHDLNRGASHFTRSSSKPELTQSSLASIGSIKTDEGEEEFSGIEDSLDLPPF